jgi:hypothetical protein
VPRTKSTKDKVRDKVLAGSRDRFWSADDLKGAGDALTVDRALAQLANQDDLRRVRRGLYWRGRQTPFGMSRPSSADLVSAVVGVKGVGPAGLSAANDLGLTTQVPAVDIVAVPKRAPRAVSRVRFVDRSARSGRITAGLGATEVALLEVLGDWVRLVELDDDAARRRMVGLVQSGAVSVNKLVRAAPQEPPAVRGRLRGLLDAAGEHQAALRVPPPRSPVTFGTSIW